ncbi:MAG: alanyl-tRNA editing protein [Byssovorax sp.]
MSPITRLHYDDALLLGFEATVVAHASAPPAVPGGPRLPSVVLDRSAFYPESGGQMADRGTLGALAVADVQVDDAGLVHHVLEGGALPPVGATVEGRIDRARRRAHMALHTGQHMLSRALEDLAGAKTVSSRLGESGCTIDTDRDAVDEAAVARAEDLVNSVIDDDVVVRSFFPTDEELRTLPLRRAPKVTERIRVVMVGDFDVTPCGGTHCLRSAQVGLLKVTAIERYKGKARVVFTAGSRARRELGEKADFVRDLGRELTSGPQDIRAAIDRLRRELTETKEALGDARARLAEAIAVELAGEAAASGRAVAVLAEASADLLRAVAARVTAVRPEAVVFLAGGGAEALPVMVARGAASRFDCGAFLKRAAAAAGGRGGGRPEHAQGQVPKGTDWPALVASIAPPV